MKREAHCTHGREFNTNSNTWGFILRTFITETKNIFNYSFEITDYQLEFWSENKEANVPRQFLTELEYRTGKEEGKITH